MYGGDEAFIPGPEGQNPLGTTLVQEQSFLQQQSLTHYPLFVQEEPLVQAPYNQHLTSTTLTTAMSPEAMVVTTAPMNGIWPSASQFPPLPTCLPPQPHSLPSLAIRPAPSHSSPTPATPLSSLTSHINYTTSPSPSSPTRSSSSAPSPTPSTSTSSSSGRKYPKKSCQAAIADPKRYGYCRYEGQSKELKKHYRTTHPEFAKKNGQSLDRFPCPVCGKSLVRKDFVVRHQKRNVHKITGEEKPSSCENEMMKRQKKTRG